MTQQHLLLSLSLLLSGCVITAHQDRQTMAVSDHRGMHSQQLKNDLIKLLDLLDDSTERSCCPMIMNYLTQQEDGPTQESAARVLSEAFSVLNNNKKSIEESSFHQIQTALINHSIHLCPALLASSGCAAMLQEYATRGMTDLDLLNLQESDTTRGLAIDANNGITANAGPIINLQGGNTLISGTLLLNPAGILALSATGTIGSTSLQLNATGSGSVTQRAAPTTTSYTITWPNAVASSNGQALTSDTSGNLSWTSIVSPANAIVNGGNTFGTAISIGSNDNFSTSIRTNSTDRLTVSATGGVSVLTNFDIPNTTGSVGLITKNANRFIHNFGTDNTFVGINAGNLTLSGTNNASFGTNTLQNLTSGGNNTAFGSNALSNTTTGINNIAVGRSAGSSLAGGDSNNIMIGATGTGGDSGTIRIGTAGVHTATYVTGITGVNIGSNSAAVFVSSSGNTNQLGTVPSSRRFKDNIRSIDTSVIDKVMKLNPVSFTYRSDESRFVDYGLIAEEVAELLPGLVAYGDDKKPFTVRYHVLPSLLLQIVKNQQESIEACLHEIKELQHDAQEQRTTIAQLMKNVR